MVKNTKRMRYSTLEPLSSLQTYPFTSFLIVDADVNNHSRDKSK